MILVNSVEDLTSPKATSPKIFGIAIALDQKKIPRLQCVSRYLTGWNVNFFNVRQIQSPVLNVCYPDVRSLESCSFPTSIL